MARTRFTAASIAALSEAAISTTPFPSRSSMEMTVFVSAWISWMIFPPGPMMGPMDSPDEMATDFDKLMALLGSDATYRAAFQAAYPDAPIDKLLIARVGRDEDETG